MVQGGGLDEVVGVAGVGSGFGLWLSLVHVGRQR